MSAARFTICGFVAPPLVVYLGLAGTVVVTAVGSIYLRDATRMLRDEQMRLLEQQTKLKTEGHQNEAKLRAIASEETQLKTNPALSSGKQRLIERAWLGLGAKASVPARGAASGGPGLSVQSKAGKIYFPELLADPEYSRAASVIERLQIETDYSRLFATLKLTAAEREKLVQLLTEREMAKQDIFGLEASAAPAEVMQHRVQAAREWKSRLKEEFGSECVQAVDAYDGTILLRFAVAALETRLRHTETPLTPAQAERLHAALVAALGAKVGSRYWSIPDGVIAQMQMELAPPQMATLKQIQEEQLGLIEARDVRSGEARQPGRE